MKIYIIACGQMRDRSQIEYLKNYTDRMSWPLQIKEISINSSKKTPAATIKKTEAEAILKAIPASSYIFALDENGTSPDSIKFATDLEMIRDNGAFQSITFIIGGAHGLAEGIIKRANKKIAFGSMTWPHMMVRIMLCEQIYRAQQILSGHPYHKE
jgi:23S rRNA (pseudouridine1915-N3)-methyltransferase